MSDLINISEAASLALHTMALLAARPGQNLVNQQIASELGVSGDHLAKVMQRLGKAGLVNSRRGPKGGFSLARPAGRISLKQVYEAIEGPLSDRPCLLGHPVCTGECILGGLISQVGQKTREYLENTKLSQLTGAFPQEDGNGAAA